VNEIIFFSLLAESGGPVNGRGMKEEKETRRSQRGEEAADVKRSVRFRGRKIKKKMSVLTPTGGVEERKAGGANKERNGGGASLVSATPPLHTGEGPQK